jgi:Holliday junction resolvase RusA-like endonuclease
MSDHDTWTTLDDPCEVAITFHHPRPAAHYGTGRNAGTLKPSAPTWKGTAPDIDKLTRAVLDALTASRVIRDDARVARLVVDDLWADAATGARITITPLDSSPAVDSTPTAGEARTTRDTGVRTPPGQELPSGLDEGEGLGRTAARAEGVLW